jgi:hypothetical protein
LPEHCAHEGFEAVERAWHAHPRYGAHAAREARVAAELRVDGGGVCVEVECAAQAWHERHERGRQ